MTEAARLAPLRPVVDVSPTSVPATVPAGRFESGRSDPGTGGREFMLFVPRPTADTGPRPLVVMLHGSTQDPAGFAAGTEMNDLARAHDLYVLYPAQCPSVDADACWNWNKEGHQERDLGEPAVLVDLARGVIAGHAIDESRVYVAGLSAGGAMASILGQAYPDVFAAVGIHSEDLPGATVDFPGTFAEMKGQSGQAALLRVPTIVFHSGAGSVVGERSSRAGDAGRDARRRATAARQGSRVSASGRGRWSREGRAMPEHWVVHGAAQGWNSDRPPGGGMDPDVLDASVEMLRFFLQHRIAVHD